MSDKNKNNNVKPEDMNPEDVQNIEQAENLGEEAEAQELIEELKEEEDELSQVKAQLEKEKKEYLFLMAEFDNFRKRTLKEKAEIIKNAAGQAMKGLLPIVDDFERGLEATKEATDASSVREGMELIYNKLVKYMEANGVKAMETNGEAFDSELHEAIAQVPAQSEDRKGKVIDTVSKGYTINDKVLRHAKVVVAQ